MKIKNIVHVNAVLFEQIDIGSVFEYHDIIYMKTEPCDDKTLGILNAITIEHAMFTSFCDDTIVHPIEGYYHVEKIW